MSGYSRYNDIDWPEEEVISGFWKKFRYKKWDFYAVYTDTMSAAVALVDASYVQNVFISIYESDNRSGKPTKAQTIDKKLPPWNTLEMSKTPISGRSFYNSSDFFFEFQNLPGKSKKIVARYKDYIDIEMNFDPLSPSQEGMLRLFQSEGSVFTLTNKQYNYNVNGKVNVNGLNYDLRNEGGMMDWSRGISPYFKKWIWASAQGTLEGEKFAINLGSSDNEINYSSSPGCAFLGDKLIKLGSAKIKNSNMTEVWEFEMPKNQHTENYAFVKFYPDDIFPKSINYLVVKSVLYQMFGHFEGVLKTPEKEYQFKLRGLVEWHYARW